MEEKVVISSMIFWYFARKWKIAFYTFATYAALC